LIGVLPSCWRLTIMVADNTRAKELAGKKNTGDHQDVSIEFPPTFLTGKLDLQVPLIDHGCRKATV